MKRSELNKIIADGIDFLKIMHYALPPFAYWSPHEWAAKGEEFDEIRENKLGWDITDFGSGDYSKMGLQLFTVRNGNLNNPTFDKPYCEKIMIVEEEQVTPYHFHWEKVEDIINRGGGNLLIQIFESTQSGVFSEESVNIRMDGRNYTVDAGSVLSLTPGESITLRSGQYHSFWGEKGKGKVLVGEISMTNDDKSDNRFYREEGRFPYIEEDVPLERLLCFEYPKYLGGIG